nr:putative integron gene cassette protein [uncultured bacterium]
MPLEAKARCICRKPKRRCLSAPCELSARPVRSDSLWSGNTAESGHAYPKPANVTNTKLERAPRTWPKSNRDARFSEEQCQAKLMNHSRKRCNNQMLFCRLTPELSRPAAGRRTRASVAYARGRCHDAGSA